MICTFLQGATDEVKKGFMTLTLGVVVMTSESLACRLMLHENMTRWRDHGAGREVKGHHFVVRRLQTRN